MQFTALAEETGLIREIVQWVIETACSQIKDWQNDELTPELVLSINAGSKQFQQADFVDQVKATLQRHAINPDRLKFELTESMLLDNVAETIATMRLLNDAGIRFSLDDLGMGNSSLQYLKQLPLDQLKIDRSFVRDLANGKSDKAIVSAIIAMAPSLDMDVIAEGVKTREQHDILTSRGCFNFQGYLFGEPLPIELFETLLKQTSLDSGS